MSESYVVFYMQAPTGERWTYGACAAAEWLTLTRDDPNAGLATQPIARDQAEMIANGLNRDFCFWNA